LADDLVVKVSGLNNGSEAIAVRADLRDIDAPERIVGATRAAFGSSIDILVNNAGVEITRAITEITAEDFALMFDVNVRAAFLMTKAVVPHLRAPGRIINISSVGARSGFDKLSLYSSTKAALEGMTRGLARELGSQGHTVNAVEPGPVQSEMLDQIPKEIVELQKKTTAVENRIGTVEEVAAVVGWLAEEQSKWISGQTISASGGWLML
jgi:3-oxoacyl-[acyl-carrier protein] reductase